MRVWIVTETRRTDDGDCESFVSVNRSKRGAIKVAVNAANSHNVNKKQVVVQKVSDDYTCVYLTGEKTFEWWDVMLHWVCK